MRVNISYILLALTGLAACSEKRIETSRGVLNTAVIEVAGDIPESRVASYDDPVSVGFDADVPADCPESRAVLGDDWRTVSWTENDEVVLWASDLSGGDAIEGGVFRYYNQSAENAARFTGNMKVAADEYECVAVYPAPMRTLGRRVTYNIPEVQDGMYRSELDIMSSDPARGKLAEVSDGTGVRLTMHHRCHALRITIPEGRNRWGKPITRLLVEFPREVAGDLSFDLPAAGADGDIALTDGKRTIELDLSAAPLDASTDGEPRYAWVFIAPGPVDGDISFTPLFEDGYCAETLSATVDREFAGGRVTPINLTVSAVEQPVTWLDFTVDHSQLGEPVDLLTVTAPENARFRGDMGSATVRTDADGKFRVGYYAKFYPDAFNGAKVDLVYDSAHAVVEGAATLPAAPIVDGHNDLSVKAPYLFFEDFGGVNGNNNNVEAGGASVSSDNNSVGLAFMGLSDQWSGQRIGSEAGVAIKISSVKGVRQWRGRVTAPCLPNLKDGAEVHLNVSFDMSGYQKSGYICTCTLGFSDDTQNLKWKYDDGLTSVMATFNPPTDGGYDSIDRHCSYDTKSGKKANGSSRLSWLINYGDGGGAFSYQTYYLFIDNIRVSIAQ